MPPLPQVIEIPGVTPEYLPLCHAIDAYQVLVDGFTSGTANSAVAEDETYIKLVDEKPRKPTRHSSPARPSPPHVPRIEPPASPPVAPPTVAALADLSWTTPWPLVESAGCAGQFPIKPPLPKFTHVTRSDGKPALKTHCSPLPALKMLKPREAVSTARRLRGMRAMMPGSNAYPLASYILKMPGAEMLEPDEAELGIGGSGTARSGQSSFRPSSARWRTPREPIDNSALDFLRKSARGRTDCRISQGAEQQRHHLRNERERRQAEFVEAHASHVGSYAALKQKLRAAQPSAGTSPFARLTSANLTGRRTSQAVRPPPTSAPGQPPARDGKSSRGFGFFSA